MSPMMAPEVGVACERPEKPVSFGMARESPRALPEDGAKCWK